MTGEDRREWSLLSIFLLVISVAATAIAFLTGSGHNVEALPLLALGAGAFLSLAALAVGIFGARRSAASPALGCAAPILSAGVLLFHVIFIGRCALH